MSYRAVVFDLWQTLAVFDVAAARETNRRMALCLGVSDERFVEAWNAFSLLRSTGPLLAAARAVCTELGVEDERAEELVAIRRADMGRTLALRADAEPTVAELRRRGFELGLITICSEDTAEAWEETPIARSFGATVFSCLVALCKPDRRVYELACARLGVEPGECLFVGDGANEELPGAVRAGMDAVQLRVPGEERAAGAESWTGPVITSLGEVLALV
ncbi:MAG TPA: HAD family hydrolase [Gaiellaceae bacterium]|nr:HAD family hydrolase [Gaiellaceae bacterium]